MNLAVFFRVVEMHAHESGEHIITIMEQRRPLPPREVQPPPGYAAGGLGPGGPINPGRGLAQGLEAQHNPPVLIHVPVTPEQFAGFRISQILEMGAGAESEKATKLEHELHLRQLANLEQVKGFR